MHLLETSDRAVCQALFVALVKAMTNTAAISNVLSASISPYTSMIQPTIASILHES